jgi:hypothetical protein
MTEEGWLHILLGGAFSFPFELSDQSFVDARN